MGINRCLIHVKLPVHEKQFAAGPYEHELVRVGGGGPLEGNIFRLYPLYSLFPMTI